MSTEATPVAAVVALKLWLCAPSVFVEKLWECAPTTLKMYLFEPAMPLALPVSCLVM